MLVCEHRRIISVKRQIAKEAAKGSRRALAPHRKVCLVRPKEGGDSPLARAQAHTIGRLLNEEGNVTNRQIG